MVKEKRGNSSNVDFLFEVSWEVCNKVGGIYTVIKSKIPQTIKQYGDRYCLIGPYFHNKIKGEFEEMILPDEFREGSEILKEIGIVIHYGKWLTDGNPATILLDFKPFFEKSDDIKKQLWDRFKIDSLNSKYEFDEPTVWAWAAGICIERFMNKYKQDWKISAVFHEWLAGAGLLYLKSQKCKIGTIFVTHATTLGRSLANAGIDLYHPQEDGNNILETMDFDKEAYIEARKRSDT